MIALLLGPGLALAAPVFVSAAQARALVAEGAVVVDARSEADWGRGHLPGAGSLPWTALRDGWLRVGRLTDDRTRLQAAAQAAGVDADAPVLVYDAGAAGWGEAGRAWWTLVYLGHPSVSILDGGLPAWRAAGGPVQEGRTRPPPGDLRVEPQERLRTRLSELGPAVAAGARLWDVREAREFAGATPYGEARGGHLPGAVHLAHGELLREDGTLRPEAELRARLAQAGLTPDRPVVPYCTGGVRSAFAMAVLVHLGFPEVAHYDGGTWEYAADAGRPLE